MNAIDGQSLVIFRTVYRSDSVLTHGSSSEVVQIKIDCPDLSCRDMDCITV